MSIDLAFAKHTPSLFLVSSPFQILCAREAIIEFEINDYLFIFVTSEQSPRFNQMCSTAALFNYNYEVINRHHKINDILWSERTNNVKFKRVFVGDYLAYSMRTLTTLFSERGATIVYLDDGTSVIPVLKNICNTGPLWFRTWCTQIRRRKGFWKISLVQKCLGIHDDGCLFTMYQDIPTIGFSIYPNTFKHLLDNYILSPSDKKILIVGPVFSQSSEELGIKEDALVSIFEDLLLSIKEKNIYCEITYIPHGRDTNKEIHKICNCHNVTYKKISYPIELYFIYEKYIPNQIYGLNSTALLNFKKMLPSLSVVNLFVNNSQAPRYDFYKDVADYYENNGIKTKLINIEKN